MSQSIDNLNPPSPEVPAGRAKLPVVNTVGMDDLLGALGAGINDFRTAPSYGLFFGGIYAGGGWLLIMMLLYLDLPYLVYPLAAGFALIAPFVACGFYVVSQRLEDDEPLNWSVVLGTVRIMCGQELGWMALVTGFSLFIWMDIAALLSFGFMGFQLFSFSDLVELIFTTPLGLMFLFVGNLAGAIIAFAVFSYSVVSIPMLFHRKVDFVTAMITSVRLVIHNPRVMAVWCIIIAALMAVSLLSGLIGLVVTLPVLGHATWHLYRRGVA
jgi:uncharacterized membrane protein